MALSIAGLAKAMVGAAKGSLGKKWPIIKEFMKAEAKKTAEQIASIERMRLSGEISQKEAQLLMDMQRNASKSVLLTVEGLGLLAAEAAINAAFGAVRTTVNKALGFALI